MTWLCRILSFVVVVEVVAFSWQRFAQQPETAPPEPNLKGYPAFTAQQLREAIDSTRPEVADDWDRLGRAFLACGFYAEANRCYEQASQLAPDEPRHAYNWGFCLFTLGELDAADEQFEKAIADGYARPEECRYFLGANALRRGRIEEAEAAFEASFSVSASKLELAELAVHAQDFERAQSLLEELVQELPHAGRVHQLLGTVAQHQFDEMNATRHFGLSDVFLKRVLGPWDDCAKKIEAVAMTMRVKEHATRSEYDLQTESSVEQLYDSISRENEQLWDPDLENLLADLDAEQNRLDSALRRLKSTIRRNGANTNLTARLGFLQLAIEPAAAEATFRTGVRLGTGDGIDVREVAGALARLLHQQGNSEGRDQFASVAEFRNGTFLLDRLEFAAAADSFERAAALDASSQRSWFWLGRTRQLNDDHPAAIAAFDKCLELNPYHERAAKFRALSLDEAEGG